MKYIFCFPIVGAERHFIKQAEVECKDRFRFIRIQYDDLVYSKGEEKK